MNKAFSNFTWRNTPSIDTPLNARNLNSMNNGIDTIDDRVIVLDTNKADKTTVNQDIKSVSYNATTGVWKFTHQNGTVDTFDQNIEKIPVSFSMSSAGVITMTTADGTKYTADVATLIKTYTFATSSDVRFNTVTDASGNKTITAFIVNGSITADKLEPNYLANIMVQVATAEAAADSAMLSANNASADALLAQSYAVGNTGVRTGENTDNAKYYKEQAGIIYDNTVAVKDDIDDLHDDTVAKHDDTVVLKNETQALFNNTEEAVNTIIANAMEEVSPSAYVDLTTGELMYQAGAFNLMVDETQGSATEGDLLWEVRA